MADMSCGFLGDREEALIAYLYDDGHAIERASFDAHLATCVQCREEVAELRGVRGQLATWSAPAPKLGVVRASERGWRAMPAWAQVAAALLVLGVAAGIANLDVRYDSSGLSVRTGWTGPSKTERARGEASAMPASAVAPADLSALERRLRAEFRAIQVPAVETHGALVRASAPGALDAETMRRIRALVDQAIDASERRQRNELALRVAQTYNDLSSQRRADLAKIDRNFGFLQSNTRVVSDEALRQREALQRLNSYIVNVSQKVPQ